MHYAVQLRDGQGRRWDVAYEYVESNMQRHSSLNAGWSHLCRANNLRVGDSIIIQRGDSSEGREAVVVRSVA